MGVYSNNTIFGIMIYTFNDDDLSEILLEQKYDLIMNDEQKREAYLFYMELRNKDGIFFKIYTECGSTLDIINKDSFMMWQPLPLNLFLEKFNV
jgi:hypothetical protein